MMKGCKKISDRDMEAPRKLERRDPEELALFNDMSRRQRERALNLLLPVADDLDSNSGPYHMSRIPSGKKGSTNDFFPFDQSDKNDYDWLKTPPATPLFPSLEMEVKAPNLIAQKEIPILQPMKYSRFADKSLEESKSMPKPNSTSAASKSSKSHNPTSSSSRSVAPTQGPTVTPKPLQTSSDAPKKPTFSKPSKPRSRGVSPMLRPPVSGFPDEAPPNLRTSAPPVRPSSTSKVRPVTKSWGSSEGRASSATRRQSWAAEGGGGGGVVVGSSMVDKVMKARRTSRGGGEKDPKPIYRVSPSNASATAIGTGFGKLVPKSSLDAALKHLELKRNSSNYHKFSTPSTRSSTTTSSNSSLNLSPRSARREEIEDDAARNPTYPVKGVNRKRFGLR